MIKKLIFYYLLLIPLFVLGQTTWNFNNTNDGWSSTSSTTTNLESSLRIITSSTTSNPTLSIANANIDATVNKWVAITLKAGINAPTFLRISYPKADLTRVYVNTVITNNDSFFKTYYFNMTSANWTGTINDLKLHFKLDNGTPSGGNYVGIDSRLDIDKIEITPFLTNNYYGFNSDFESWNVTGTSSIQEGSIVITSPGGSATKIEQSVYGLNTSEVNYVHIVYKNPSENNRIRFQFQNSDDNLFKGQNANVSSGMTDFDVITFDFSNDTNWFGFVKKMQVIIQNPANDNNYASSGDFYIDKIIFSNQPSLINYKLNQTISFSTVRRYAIGEGSFEYFATSSSGLPVMLSSSNTSIASVLGDFVNLNQVGQSTLIASQSGNEFFNEGIAILRTLEVIDNPINFATWNFDSTAPLTSSNNSTNLLSLSDLLVVNSISTDGVTGANTRSNYIGASGNNNLQIGCRKDELVIGDNGSAYIEFSVIPNTGHNFTLTDISFGYRDGLSGPVNFVVRSSVDDFQEDLIQGNLNPTGTWYFNNYQFNNLQQIFGATTYRIYLYGGANNAGLTSNFKMDDLSVRGFVSQNPAPSITSPLTASGTYGVSFSYETNATNLPSSYSAEGLPSGLIINAETGLITGTPAVAGVFNVSLSATNLSGTDTQTLVISIVKVEQTITFNSLSSKTYGDLPFELDGTASSGLTVSYTSSNPSVATLEGNVLTIVGAGTTLITASQAGNDNYNSALEITRELVVNKADQTITFELLENRLDTDASFTLTASATSGLPVSFISDNESVLSINGNVATILGSGTVVITAVQEGNDNYNAAVAISQDQVIINTSLANQEITFEPIAEQVYGNAPIVLNATASSGLIVTYVSSDETIATIDGNSVTLLQPGTVTITANQVGNASYNPAPASSQSLVIVKKQLTVSEVVVADKSYDGTTSAQVSSYQLNGIVGVDEVELTNTAEFEQANVGQNIAVIPNFELVGLHADRYNLVQPTNVVGNIVKADQVLVFEALPSKVYGDAPFEISAVGGASGEPIVFTSSDETIATVLGNQVTILAGGTVQITASQLGNENYNDAISVSQELVIARASQAISNFNSPGIKYLGSQPVVLSATSSSGLVITYSSANSNVVSIEGDVLTFVGLGTTQIYAHQEGNQNFEPAISLERNVTVAETPVAAWNLTGLNHTNPNPIISASATTFTNLVATNGANLLTRGPEAPSSSGANSFRTTGFKNDGISIENQDYFQFKLQPAEGFLLSLSSINCFVGGTNTFWAEPGVTSQFAYSLDGLNFTLIGQPQTSILLALESIDLTQISELQNIPNGTTVTFRYFASGQTTDGGWGFRSPAADSDALAIGGTLVALPATPQITVTQNCDGTVTLSTDATGTLLWSTNETSSSITISTAGTYSVSQTIDGLTSNLGTVDVVPVVISSPIVDNQTFCSVDTPRVSDIVVLGQNIKVYSDSEKTMLLSSETPLESATYYVTQTIDTCESEVVAVQITVNQSYTYYVDADGDGYGSEATAMLCESSAPAGYSVNNTDCDDTNADVWQSGDFYVDADADTYGTGEAVSLCYGSATPAGYAMNNTDCDDSNIMLWQSGLLYVDSDGDGYDNGSATVCYGASIPEGYVTATLGSDCNDADTAIHEAVLYYVDTDGDGYGSEATAMLCESSAPAGYSVNNTDCDDTNADVWRTGDFYVDADADTYGTGEAVSLCYGAATPVGYAIQAGDCNDSSATVNPGATEICGNGIDDNCNGSIDEGCVVYSQVQSSQCGVTIGSLSNAIYANMISGATSYTFEVTEGSTVREFTPSSGLRYFNLNQLTGGSLYATTYSIRVNYLKSGVWSGYGPSCEVTTPAVPTSKVQTSQCGVTLASLGTQISANSVSNVTTYRFEVTDGLTVSTYDSATRQFQLTQVSGLSLRYATTYQIRVKLLINNGQWSEYGESCDVTTPSLPLTKVQTSQCGVTVAARETLIYADAVTGVSGYRFEVTRPNNTVAVVTTASGNDRSFSLSQVAADFGEAYSVRVAVLNNGVWGEYGTVCTVSAPDPLTQVQASQCGITLGSLTTPIYADAVSGATRYRFQVTRGSEVREYTTSSGSIRYFNLTQLDGGSNYGAAYFVKVAVEYRGSWRAYGTGCYVTTPTPTTKVQTSQCGITLASLNTIISANSVSNVSAYRFEVTKEGGEVRTFDSSTRQFYLAQLNRGSEFATYATTYSIRVALKSGGSWMEYGESCNVTTPSLPTTKLQGAYCGRTNVTGGARLYASRVLGASAYRFRITNGLDQAEYTTASASVYWFKMNDVDIPYITGTTYNVEVAVLNNGVWGPYGDVCTITTRGTAPTSREEVVKEDTPSKVIFAVKGYPNPYTSYFTVSLETPSASMVYVRVFDMTGKLIEDREVAPSQLEELQLGSEWSRGVYNVIVAQDDQVKTIRMVKQE